MILDKFKLDGRIALVTGASRGLGRAIAVALAEAGADVACHSSKAGNCNSACGEIEASGRRAFALNGDMADKHTPSADC